MANLSIVFEDDLLVICLGQFSFRQLQESKQALDVELLLRFFHSAESLIDVHVDFLVLLENHIFGVLFQVMVESL